ncbi:MAG: amino acid carrier protein, partial [Clostridia bacterium]|nr:amino acid carrier protein [Clostridia bacterium]
MEILEKVIKFINDNILWGIPMVILILGVGIYLTVRNRFTQITKFSYALKMTLGSTFKGVKDKKEKGKGVSQFEAFSTAIAGTVGTGNIVGVATAIISGGAGAIFWMWLSAFVGMFTNFAENVLGIYYRKKGKDGEFRGGPMYYISEGLGWKWLAIIFSVFCMLASFGMNMVQINTIADTLKGGFSIPSWVSGLVVAVVVALIIIGGIKRIGKIASYIIPFMCLGFMLMALIIIFMNIKSVPAAFAQIFKGAFSFRAVGGGVFGYAIMRAMRFGLARGIFSNEAGLGSSVIAHSASDTDEPVRQGLWGIFGVFLDTMIICTLTSLVILTSGAYVEGSSELSGAILSQTAFAASLGSFGKVIFSLILPIFAFTTILSWAY